MKISLGDGKNLNLDSDQIEVYHSLKNLHNHILEELAFKNQKQSFFQRILSKILKNNQNNIFGLYIYGDVGRGKSMLMNHFFDNVKIKNKIHIHFNEFMQKVHRELYILRKTNLEDRDLVEVATRNIIKDNILLCFDEFQVEDVADALILRRIFTYIFHNNVKVVFTSNTHPKNLYKNGLQRGMFIKFVQEILLKYCNVINLDSETDYRNEFSKSVNHYYQPINFDNEKKIFEIVNKITNNSETTPKELEVMGRKLLIKNTYKNIAIFDFKELCAENLGVADYQLICQKFKIIFLLNIPILKKEDRNEAKRLILFIDELYQSKNTLFILADCQVENIFKEGSGSDSFKRTISRINEIMSNYTTLTYKQQ